jgi:hypothetical protein
MPHPRRQHHAAVVIGQLLIGAIDARLIARRPRDAGLEIVRHQRPRHPADRRKGMDMRRDPVCQRLAPARLRVGEVRSPKRSHEDMRPPLLTACRVGQRDGVARPVDEQLVAGHMRLPHRRRKAPAPRTVAFAEPAVGAALRMFDAILLPQQHQRHAATLELRMDVRPVRLMTLSPFRRVPRRKQPPLQLGIIDLVRQRPAQARYRRTAQVIADRCLADSRRLADKPPAQPHLISQTQYVSYLPHRHSLRRHRLLPVGQGARSADSNVDGHAR